METLHDRFEIPGALIEATQALYKTRPHSLDPIEQMVVAEAWLTAATETLGLPGVSIALEPEGTATHYDPHTWAITLRRFTVFDLLHCFRHHHQWNGGDLIDRTPGDRDADLPHHEIDALAWAATTFNAAQPSEFLRLAYAGRLPGVPARYYADAAVTPGGEN